MFLTSIRPKWRRYSAQKNSTEKKKKMQTEVFFSTRLFSWLAIVFSCLRHSLNVFIISDTYSGVTMKNPLEVW